MLELLAKGWSHRRIGILLGISHQAVTYHARALVPRCPRCHAPLSRRILNEAARIGEVRVAL